eukprot:Hpha_TRINITY_DN36234_c0_g1::TRINITY_DN36234_c0_g1_i1::g.83307::m.83307
MEGNGTSGLPLPTNTFGDSTDVPLWGSILLLATAVLSLVGLGPPAVREQLLKVVTVRVPNAEPGSEDKGGNIYRLLAVLEPGEVGAAQYVQLLLQTLLCLYMQFYVPFDMLQEKLSE